MGVEQRSRRSRIATVTTALLPASRSIANHHHHHLVTSHIRNLAQCTAPFYRLGLLTSLLISVLPSWTVVAYVRRRLMTSSSRQPDWLPSAIVPLPAVDSGTVYHLTLHPHKLFLSSVTV